MQISDTQGLCEKIWLSEQQMDELGKKYFQKSPRKTRSSHFVVEDSSKTFRDPCVWGLGNALSQKTQMASPGLPASLLTLV